MLKKILSATPLLATGAIAVGLGFAPTAVAAPRGCSGAGGAVVCQGNGSSSVYATPPAIGGGFGGFGGGFGNGPYGPAGSLPPVGGF